MIKKKSLALSIIILMVAAMLCVTVIFAWFTSNSTINDITIKTGEMKIKVFSLKLAEDFNRDGILDGGNDNPTFVNVTIADPDTETAGFNLPADILPLDEFYYKMIVENTGDFAGTLSATYTAEVKDALFEGDVDSLTLTMDKVDYGKNNDGVALTVLEPKATAIMYFKIKFTHATNSIPYTTKSIKRTLNIILTQPEKA